MLAGNMHAPQTFLPSLFFGISPAIFILWHFTISLFFIVVLLILSLKITVRQHETALG